MHNTLIFRYYRYSRINKIFKMPSMIHYQSLWTCRIQNRTKPLENSQIQVDFIPCQVHQVTTEVSMSELSTSIRPVPIRVVTVNRHKFSALEHRQEYQTIPQVIHQELIIHCLLLKIGTLARIGLVSNLRKFITRDKFTVFRSEFVNVKRASLSSL